MMYAKGRRSLWTRFKAQKALFFMIIPCMLFTFVFNYYPLSGWIMAFQNFKPAKGYFGSKFVGLYQFEFLFSSPEVWYTIRNTLAMSTISLMLGFIFSITFALLLNEIRALKFRAN